MTLGVHAEYLIVAPATLKKYATGRGNIGDGSGCRCDPCRRGATQGLLW